MGRLLSRESTSWLSTLTHVAACTQQVPARHSLSCCCKQHNGRDNNCITGHADEYGCVISDEVAVPGLWSSWQRLVLCAAIAPLYVGPRETGFFQLLTGDNNFYHFL